MNKKQFWLMWVLALIVVLMVLFPPWRGRTHESAPPTVILRYAPIWSYHWDIDQYSRNITAWRTGIDLGRFSVQLVGLAALGTALMITFGRRRGAE